MVLRDFMVGPYFIRIRHNVLKIKGIIILCFAKPGNPDKILHPKHVEMPVQVSKIALQGAVIEIGPGIVRPVYTQVMVRVLLQVRVGGEKNGGKDL